MSLQTEQIARHSYSRTMDETRRTGALAIYRELERGVEILQTPERGNLVRSSDSQTPIQRWFQYREGYTVDLCDQIFAPNEEFVVDPFCGFGSTLLAARRRGIPALGIDANPLAAFVSRVKTRNYSNKILSSIKLETARLARARTVSSYNAPPELRIIDQLFHPEILTSLLSLKRRIDEVEDGKLHDFLTLGWISILEDVSNVFREGNGIKYRNRVRRGNTYKVSPYDDWAKKRFPADKFGFVKNALTARLHLMISDVENETRSAQEPQIFHADASDLTKLVPGSNVSLALFSPPYCNCFNYIKAYKLELWMAGFIRNYPDIKRLTAMGIRSRVESVLDPVCEDYIPEVDFLIELMDPEGLWSAQLPEVVRGYFADMQSRMMHVHSVLKPGGRCVIVVGNSAYAGVIIPTDLLLARTAENLGFKVERLEVCRHLTTSSQQRTRLLPVKDYMRETVIHLSR